MIVCVCCKKEMSFEKSGVAVKSKNGTIYSADYYKCPLCGYEVLTGFGSAHDPRTGNALWNNSKQRFELDA